MPAKKKQFGIDHFLQQAPLFPWAFLMKIDKVVQKKLLIYLNNSRGCTKLLQELFRESTRVTRKKSDPSISIISSWHIPFSFLYTCLFFFILFSHATLLTLFFFSRKKKYVHTSLECVCDDVMGFLCRFPTFQSKFQTTTELFCAPKQGVNWTLSRKKNSPKNTFSPSSHTHNNRVSHSAHIFFFAPTTIPHQPRRSWREDPSWRQKIFLSSLLSQWVAHTWTVKNRIFFLCSTIDELTRKLSF